MVIVVVMVMVAATVMMIAQYLLDSQSPGLLSSSSVKALSNPRKWTLRKELDCPPRFVPAQLPPRDQRRRTEVGNDCRTAS
jgi:hypothetical protein